MVYISDIKLIRTDTTLDLSQKAEKGMIWTEYRCHFYILSWSSCQCRDQCGTLSLEIMFESTIIFLVSFFLYVFCIQYQVFLLVKNSLSRCHSVQGLLVLLSLLSSNVHTMKHLHKILVQYVSQ